MVQYHFSKPFSIISIRPKDFPGGQIRETPGGGNSARDFDSGNLLQSALLSRVWSRIIPEG